MTTRSEPGYTGATVRPVRLLISVRSVAEAQAAVAGGADLIDVKEPAHGAMGRARPEVIAEIVRCVDGRRPVSAALGELADEADSAKSPAGLQYVKLALANAPADWRRRLARRFELARPAAGIAAAYADHALAAAQSVEQVLTWACVARQTGVAGLLIDTAVKDGENLFHWLDAQALGRCIAVARAAGLLVALAGSLSGTAFEQAVRLGPDIVAVRGAACSGGSRQQQIAPGRVRALAAVIAAHSGSAVQCAD